MKKYLVVAALVSLCCASLIITRGSRAQISQPDGPTVSSTLVISQFMAGTSANVNEEFVEIHNVSSSPIDLNGYRVVYRSSGGSTDVGPLASWATSTILPAGGYYLIGSDVYAASHTVDATYNTSGSGAFSTSGSAGGLAIRLGANNSGTVIDALGWGGATNIFFEGTRATAPGNAGLSISRANSGCQDTDNNSSDFGAPTSALGRNTATTPFSCSGPPPTTAPTGAGSATPNNPAPGSAVTLTVAVTPGANPTSSGITVVVDASSIGGSPNQSLFDDGTNGDTTAGDNVFNFSTIVSASAASGSKTIPFTVSDAETRISSGSFQLTVPSATNLSGSGSATPNTVLAGGSTTLTFNVTPATQPNSTGIAVTANLTSIGGNAAQAFTNAGNNAFTFNAIVAAGTPNGFKSLPISITDGQGRTGSGTIGLTVGNATDPSHVAGEHEVMGNPNSAGASSNDDWLIERNQYVLSYNCSKGIPNWVGWHIDPTWIGSATRTNNYRADSIPPLPNGCYLVQNTDYSGSGFDRGHDIPSGDRTNSTTDNDSTFLMTNFIPQAPNNNQGIWNDMEIYIRNQVAAGNEVYTWMGNAGQGGSGSNGGVTMTVAGGKVVVPAYVWRVVMVLPQGSSDLSRVDTNTRVFAVLTPNIQTANGLNSAWQTYICPVSQIEQLTGFNFFPNVPAATAAVLKSKVDSLAQPQTVAGGTYTNLTLTYPMTYLTGNVTVTGNLALGPENLFARDIAGANNYTITLGPGATVTRLNSGFVNGTLEKQFNAPNQSFTYPVGTQNGYSPVTANLTALGTNPSSLSVKAVQGVQPNANPQSTALKRYWTLTENGDLTANLVFNYLDIDVPSGVQESSLHLNKYEGFWTVPPATTDTAANTASTTTPVSSFSDWTLLPLAPTAADVAVSGRVFTADGTPLRGARVTMDDGAGHSLTAITNSFGYYSFTSVPSGMTYMLNGSARGLTFTPRVVSVNDQLADVDLIALP